MWLVTNGPVLLQTSDKRLFSLMQDIIFNVDLAANMLESILASAVAAMVVRRVERKATDKDIALRSSTRRKDTKMSKSFSPGRETSNRVGRGHHGQILVPFV